MGKLIDYGFRLLLVCGIASLCLAGLYTTAKENIEANAQKDLETALAAVLGTSEGIEETTEGSGVYRVTREDGEVLYAAEGGAQGYSSVVEVVCSARLENGTLRVEKVRVKAQQETPGLGTVIADQESSETLWSWIASMFTGGDEEKGPAEYGYLKRLSGKTGGTLRVTLDKAEAARGDGVLGISGATISSDACVRAAKAALEKIRAAGVER
jgi:Na+-translocating ferredoxin:NAD+ oxidoreductase RnfG subunit